MSQAGQSQPPLRPCEHSTAKKDDRAGDDADPRTPAQVVRRPDWPDPSPSRLLLIEASAIRHRTQVSWLGGTFSASACLERTSATLARRPFTVTSAVSSIGPPPSPVTTCGSASTTPCATRTSGGSGEHPPTNSAVTAAAGAPRRPLPFVEPPESSAGSLSLPRARARSRRLRPAGVASHRQGLRLGQTSSFESTHGRFGGRSVPTTAGPPAPARPHDQGN